MPQFASIYAQIRDRARKIAANYPEAEFYKKFSKEYRFSLSFFKSNKIIKSLNELVGEHLDSDYGHGIDHAFKVTVDAGTLVLVEGQKIGYSKNAIERKMLIAQCAGLLHDIERKQKDHAIKGAEKAKRILSSYPLLPQEIEDVCAAIRNHEAFKDIKEPMNKTRALISNSLYDADKFRWGPDNFTDTVWEMVSYINPSLSSFISYYPKGMEGLSRIRDTFRTITGKKFGPQFIDMGISIGEELFDIILSEYMEE